MGTDLSLPLPLLLSPSRCPVLDTLTLTARSATVTLTNRSHLQSTPNSANTIVKLVLLAAFPKRSGCRWPHRYCPLVRRYLREGTHLPRADRVRVPRHRAGLRGDAEGRVHAFFSRGCRGCYTLSFVAAGKGTNRSSSSILLMLLLLLLLLLLRMLLFFSSCSCSCDLNIC